MEEKRTESEIRAAVEAILFAAGDSVENERLAEALEGFDAAGLIRASETAPAPYPAAPPRPPESFELEERESMKLR